MPNRRRATAPTSAEIARVARKQKALDLQSKRAAEERDLLKPRLVEMMRAFGSKVLEAPGVRVVLSTPQTTKYDEDGIYTTLTPSQRKLAFDEIVNISKLPATERRAIEKKMASLLTPAQRRRCTEHVFNLDRMSQAVQAGKIPIEVLDSHTEVVDSTAYTTVTLK